jgi:hypothetical protein
MLTASLPTIALVSMLGSTGDLRPLLARALALRLEGYGIKLFGRDEYLRTCSSFGLGAAEWYPLRSTPSSVLLDATLGQTILHRENLTRADRKEPGNIHVRETAGMVEQLLGPVRSEA